jgi:acetolactate synthase-1/2/3 large subunit
VAALQAAGAECLFGLPGTQNVALFEALHGSGLRSVVATSELSAAMMANGYYRASGKPGVLLTIPGPGFAWALPGIAEAALDSAAIVHITSAPAAAPGRRFQLQAIDQAAMAAPAVRKTINIERAADAAAAIAEAWHACRAGEPGPVLVQVAQNAWEESAAVDSTDGPSVGASPTCDVSPMAAGLMDAKRCMLLLGQGCDDAGDEAARLAERLGAVIVTTTSGRGVVAEDHPRSLGFALAGNDAGVLNALVEASDVVLAVGCKFSHNGSRGFRLRIPVDKLMHVDASGEVLDANYPARIAVRADAHACIAALLDALGSGNADGFTLEEIAQWRLRCAQEKARGTVEPRVHVVAGGTPAAFFAALRAALPRESCLVTDSGRHQQLARRHFPVLCARGLITPTNLQSMGFGIGAAIGAKLAEPSRPVVALIGDGGLAMSGLELLTAVRERIDLTVIVFVDGAYGAIRDQQFVNYGRASGTEFAGPDCAALAEAVGARHVRLHTDVEATLKSAIESPGVTIVEVALGDTMPMHWTRAKAVAKARLGRRLKGWWQALRRRR